jgi:hypothetical protein
MNLQRLEAQLRTLVESRLIRVLPGQKPEELVVQRLIDAMQANTQTDRSGRRLAPNVYTLLVQPGSLQRWNEPRVVKAVLEILTAAGQDSGFHFDGIPAITFAEDTRTSPGELHVVASHKIETVARTQEVDTDTARERRSVPAAAVPENSFLIVEGVKEFPLKQPVINIGRRLDNNLVVDDPRVSRHHAQLRAIKGRFVLFDLNSSGGTFINGQRTSQSILYPGDVISLAGVSLIFGQDNPLPQRDLTKTAPHSPRGAERQTAIFRPTTGSIRKPR